MHSVGIPHRQRCRSLCVCLKNELQAEVIEPLLKALGFDNIKDVSGPRERGKDSVATKPNDFRRIELFSIQIKKWKPDAKAASSRSFGHLLKQLGQAIKEPVIHPNTKERQKPNKCLFFTPYEIPARTQENFHERMLATMNSGVEIIDGPTIIRLLLEHSPATAATYKKVVY